MKATLFAEWLCGEPFTVSDIVETLSSEEREADYEHKAGKLETIKPKSGISLSEAGDLLDQINPDCERSKWLQCAQALKHEFSADCDTEAYRLFDEWSNRGSKYKGDEDTRTVWNSIKQTPSGRAPITIASLFKMAKKACETTEAFPVEVMPPLLRDLAKQSAQVSQVPVELPAMMALAVFAAALGKSYELQGIRNGASGFANLFVIAAAERGTGKGAVAKQLVSPILDESRELANRWKEFSAPDAKADEKIFTSKLNDTLLKAKKATGSELDRLRAEAADLQRKVDAAAAQATGAPSLWASNATSEALAALLARSGDCALIYSPEAGDVLRVMAGRYRSDGRADFDLLLSGYSTEPFRQDRQTRACVDICPTLSAALLVQPSIVREVLGNPEALERGLIARCLIFEVSGLIPEDDGIEREISPQTLARWGELIRRFLALRSAPGEPLRPPRIVHCEPAARELFRAYHNETVVARNSDLAYCQGELSRCRENASRVALNVALAARGTEVDTLTLADAEAGIAIVRWATAQMLRLLQTGRREQSQQRFERLCELINEAGGHKTIRDLEKSNNFPAAEVRSLAAKFASQLHIEKIQNGGRPSEIVCLYS